MSGRFWAIATALTGLGVLGLFAVFAMLPEAKAAASCLPAGSVVQFELARNAADLNAIFGPPGAACHALAITAMDAVNTLDIHAFIPTYTLFCICAALFLSGGALRPLALAAIAAALAALAGDYLETFTLLRLSHSLEAPDSMLPHLQLGAWSKFGALAMHAFFCAGLCFFDGKRRPILGALLLLPVPGFAAAAYNHIAFSNFMNLAFAIAWLALMAMAIVGAFVGKKAEAPQPAA